MRGSGFPMGPFELMDLAGLDVNLAAAQASGRGSAGPTGFGPRRSRSVSSRPTGSDARAARGSIGTTRVAAVRVDQEFAEGPSRELRPDRIQQRIESAIADEAHIAIDEGVAAHDDVVTALRLGVAHPDRFLATI